jgi:hypothetical protein
LLRSVTGEHHVINQAWEIKSRALQPPEPWLGLQAHTNMDPCSFL